MKGGEKLGDGSGAASNAGGDAALLSDDDDAAADRPASSDSGAIRSAPTGAQSDPPDDEHTAVAGGAMLRAVAVVHVGMVLADRYQLEAALGEGGSGTVYRAWDRILGEPIAVKILHPQRAREKSWIKRLAREVRVARAIRHPNVCRVFELGNADGHWFVTMELATGGSLHNMLRATSPQSVAAASRPLADRLRDIRELCAGLGAMHAVAITHRDVTPQNVLRMGDGRLVLTDFGLAIERDDKTTVLGGTPAYMPPEAARGERSDQRSDVFQLGMIMHEVLTGVRPTWTSDGARLKLVEPPTGASVVEEELFRLVSDCVNADPALRPQSAVAVAGRLAAAEVARQPLLVVRMLSRARRFGRRHPRLMAAAGAAVLLAVVARSVQVLSRPPLCRGAAQQLAGIWDPARAEAVRRAFGASGKSYAAETFARVQTILDQHAGAWKRMYIDACEATHLRGEQSTEVLDLRMGCLKEGQGELRALVDLFSAADGEIVSRSISAASAVTPVGHCADVSVLKAVVRPPQDRETRAKVEALRQRLSEIKALHGAGRNAEGLRRAVSLVAEARVVDYGPLLGEALDALGRIEVYTGPYPEAEAVLDEAMLRAEASRHDRLLAESAVDKVSLLAMLGRTDDLNRFVLRARATLERIGGDSRLQGWIYAAIGTDLISKGRFAEAVVSHRQALEAKLRVLPPEHWDVALSRGSAASALNSLGRHAEALRENQQTIEILEHALGQQHPDLALHIHNRGEIRLALGENVQARADFERALSIWKGELPPQHFYNGYPLTGIGLALLAEGQAVGGAIEPLERAHKIREAGASPPELRAETMFALARALWQAGSDPTRDRPRALGLAKAARDLLPSEKAEDRRKVEDTLALWQRPEGGAPGRRPKPNVRP